MTVVTVPAYFNDARRQATRTPRSDRRPGGPSGQRSHGWPTASGSKEDELIHGLRHSVAARSTCPSLEVGEDDFSTAFRCAHLRAITWAATRLDQRIGG